MLYIVYISLYCHILMIKSFMFMVKNLFFCECWLCPEEQECNQNCLFALSQFFLMSLIFFACLDFLDQPQAPAGQKHQDVENNGRTGASLHADRRSGREVRSRQTPIHESDDD